jgi:hypothetical protein
LRWPEGVDVAAALEEVIRVLSVSPEVARRPDVAMEPSVESPMESTEDLGEDRLPEFE